MHRPRPAEVVEDLSASNEFRKCQVATVRQVSNQLLKYREAPYDNAGGVFNDLCLIEGSPCLQRSLNGRISQEVTYRIDWSWGVVSSDHYPPACPSRLFSQTPIFPWNPQLLQTKKLSPSTTEKVAANTYCIAEHATAGALQVSQDQFSSYPGCHPLSRDQELLGLGLQQSSKKPRLLVEQGVQCQPYTKCSGQDVLQHDSIDNLTVSQNDHDVDQLRKEPVPTIIEKTASALRVSLEMTGNDLQQIDREALGMLLSNLEAGSQLESSILQKAGVSTAGDSVFLMIVKEAVLHASSYARCKLVTKSIVLPRLEALRNPPSRALIATVEHLGLVNPFVLLKHCFEALVSSPAFNHHQAELITRAVKDFIPATMLPDILEAACGYNRSGGEVTSAKLGRHWNEQLVGLLQTLMIGKPQLSQGSLQKLVAAVEGAAHVEELQTSVKFVKLILTLVKQQGKALSPYVYQLKAALEVTRTFLTKSAIMAIAKT